MHLVVLDVVGPHGLKCARADMQRHESAAHAAALDLGQQIGIEVQPRGGCRHRAGARA